MVKFNEWKLWGKVSASLSKEEVFGKINEREIKNWKDQTKTYD